MLKEGALLSRCCPLFHFNSHFLIAKRLSRLPSLTRRLWCVAMASATAVKYKVIDSHLHVWASPEEASSGYPYFPGQEPSLNGSKDFLLQRYPSKFIGCCLANPAEDGSGIGELESLVMKEGYRAVRFNPYLWPSGQQMTNEIGKAMFAKSGELGIPVGFMCFKGLLPHLADIEQLCTQFPTTTVIIDHFGFCKPPMNELESESWSRLLGLSTFPQVYVKVSAFFRVSRKPYPYEDTCFLLSELIASYGAQRLMWGSDFPFVVKECGYKEAKDLVPNLSRKELHLSSEELEWIMGKTMMHLFSSAWVDSAKDQGI